MTPQAVRAALERAVAVRLGLAGWPNVAPHDVSLVDATIGRLLEVHRTPERALEATMAAAPGATPLVHTLRDPDLSDTAHSGGDSTPGVSLADVVLPLEAPGRYEVVRELGAGGLGRVLLVRDAATARVVALKEPHPSGSPAAAPPSAAETARFLREARITAQLEHPGIVPVYDVGRRSDGSVHYTMRRIQGRTLSEVLEQAGTLDARLRLLPAVLTVAQAVAYAHQRQVLHRDIKPQNVMLGRFGEAWLLDWGLARVKAAARTSAEVPSEVPDLTGAVVMAAGTPAYMSPEQVRGRAEALDERTDVWGLGGLLFEVLTGRSPIVGASSVEVLARIVSERVDAPKLLEPDAPVDLCAICEKALAPSPDDRYPDAAAFAADVQAWLDQCTVSARQYSQVERLALFARRNQAAVRVGALGLALTLVVGAVSLVTARRQRNDARSFASALLRDTTDVVRETPFGRRQLEGVTDRALRFIADTDPAGLPRVDQALLADAWLALSDLNLERARFEQSTRFETACAALATAVPSPPATLDDALVHARCTTLRFRAARARDDQATMRALFPSGLSLVEKPTPYDGELTWLGASADLADELSMRSQYDPRGSAHALLKRVAREHSERLLTAQPDGQSRAALRVAKALMDDQLEAFGTGREGEARRLGERSIALLERLTSTGSSFAAVQLLAKQLRQHAMLLRAGDTPDEAAPVVARARPLFEASLAMDPSSRSLRGEYADLLLIAGEPAEALAQLDQLSDAVIVGDYLVSYLLAALLADRDAAFDAQRPAIAASLDPQAHWVEALDLAQRGRLTEASARLREWGERAAAAPVFWPTGRVDVVALRAPAEAAPALGDFLRCFEAGLRRSRGDPACFAHLAEALEAAASARAANVP